jgi:hypothetical protein
MATVEVKVAVCIVISMMNPPGHVFELHVVEDLGSGIQIVVLGSLQLKGNQY